MNQHVRPLPDDFLTYVDHEELREAIDRVSILRARVIRVGLFGTMLSRPDITGTQTAEDRRHEADVMREQVTLITQVCRALNTGSDLPDTPPDIVQWMHKIAVSKPEKMAQVMHVSDLSQKVLDVVDGDATRLAAATREHMTTARQGFAELITELCDDFWHAVAQHQAKALEKATTAASLLADRLTRLEHIGSHVRLVSLNASVEAARVGEGGKGLMVIAQEFKELAEEIQTLAADAQRDIDVIS